VQAVALRRVAWMAQSPALLPWLTVLANVQLAVRFRSADQPLRQQPEDVLRMVGLEDVLHVYPATLSGGMQQRLALARTLLMGARLWLMDEPFAALDELTRERLTLEMLALWQPLQPTVLWVTHNLQEALRLADRVLVLSESPGRLLADHHVDLLRPRSDTSVAFAGELEILRTLLGRQIVQEAAA
jgi:NitT/TauT family transport system ATP-binding protein